MADNRNGAIAPASFVGTLPNGKRRKAVNAWKQLRAILLLPGMVTVVIPATILYGTGIGWPPSPWNIVLPVIGSLFILVGLALMAWTIGLFVTVGKGTPAPWNPPQKLVVRGVYRHVRNPMIGGGFWILLGEAIFFDSWPLLCLFGFFVVVNLIYIPLSEEPGLMKRFGDDYLRYKENVPRWIPRPRPWEGLTDAAELKRGRMTP
jgi:protein-S-isoprenylcysteine O-methyltransferase Ste14